MPIDATGEESTPTEKTKLKITFLLPLPGTEPIGGFKVVYEYANFLARSGHEVSVVHPAIYLIDQPLTELPLRIALRTMWLYIAKRITKKFKPTSWFQVSPSVQLLWVLSLSARNIPDSDAVIATAWQTAEWLQDYPDKKGMKYYLIQHLETWAGPEERVMATWQFPLEKIVIARWLQSIAERLGQTAHLIHNGLDFKRFAMTNPLDARDPNNLLMLFHTVEWKGTADGLAAFEIARKKEPGLKLALFGLAPIPNSLPSGVIYHQNPTQEVLRDLYNQASIFVSPSWTEGFPLPPAEALQCGAALVSTDIEGTAMYAIHEETALLNPIKNPQAMADNLIRLVRNPELRLRLAKNGHVLIGQFTWEKAGKSLEEVLLKCLERS